MIGYNRWSKYTEENKRMKNFKRERNKDGCSVCLGKRINAEARECKNLDLHIWK